MNVKAVLICLLLAPAALAQGFAGLGQSAEGFSTPERGRAFDFPRDHGPHPSYRIEWWYLTANLMGPDGTPYGVQWTVFRSATAPHETDDWTSPQSWMGHAAVTTPVAHFAAERFARGGSGQAGARGTPFAVWIDDWSMAGADDLSLLTLTARGSEFAYDLALRAQGPLVFHGDQGYSIKSAQGQASYYYSQPFYAVSGTLMLPDGPVEVSGTAWLDREYSSQPLGRTQSGWDWFSMSFDSGAKLMGFLLRDSAGDDFSAGTWIAPDGAATSLGSGAFQATPLHQSEVAGRQIPTAWRVQVPLLGIDVRAEALNANAWNDVIFAYWEGPIQITGSHTGAGYLEMTGYE